MTPVEKLKLLALAASDRRLKRSDLAILIVLSDMVNLNSGLAWPSLPTLGRKVSGSTRQVTRSIKKLVDCGYVTVVKAGGGNMSTRYAINIPLTQVSTLDTYVNSLQTHESIGVDTHVHSPQTLVSTKSVKEPIKEPDNKIKAEACPYDQILELFSQLCPLQPKLRKMTSSRKKAIKRLWLEIDCDIEQLKALFARVGASSFLNGKGNSDWKAGFDWILKGTNVIKILEGNYDNKTRNHIIHTGPIKDGLNEPAEW